MGRLFGTDGVRGLANAAPLTPEFAHRLGRVAAGFLAERSGRLDSRLSILIGRDTRLSGPLLEHALVSGILSVGVDAVTAGVLPTPAIAVLTSMVGAVGGVVLSASHNPFEDNGIKLFSGDGQKLSGEWEEAIEARLESADDAPRPTGAGLGRLRQLPDAETRYLRAVRATVPAEFDLRGQRLVLDCANGATYRVAPRLFRALGAEVIALAVRPTGTNINRGVGALHPARVQARTRAVGGAVGLAFDGDGDRLIAVDEDGEVRDGDYLLAIWAAALKARGALRGGVVVTTVMANLGLERALRSAGVGMARVQVGDRYVLEEMRRLGANLGGEQSGHAIFLDHATTGDGLVSALQLLRALRESGRSLRALSAGVTKCPQVLLNVPVRAKPAFADLPGVGEVVSRWEKRLDGRGRILVRYSGTEAVARVMVEGDDGMLIKGGAEEIAVAIQAEIGGRA